MGFKRVQTRQKGVIGYINCMRGTWLGNPFPLNKYSLDLSLTFYEHYLAWRILVDHIFREYLQALKIDSKTETILLGCGCKLGEPCHVDSLIRFIEALPLKES